MRTGSLVFSRVPGERSSSTSSESSPDSLSESRSSASPALVGRGDGAGEQVVDLAEGEVTLLLAGVDDVVYVFFVLIEFFSHGGRS